MALTLSLLLAIGGNLYLTAPPAAVAAPACTVNPMGASTPIGSNNGYTFFTSGDAVLGNTEMEGTLAVGGSAKFGDSSANTNQQYPIFQGGVGGNADYGIPKIDGEWSRILLNRYAPGTQTKVVQVKADGLTATPGLAKFVQVDSPSGYTFRKDYGSSGTTFWPSGGDNNSAQFASFVQPWKGSTDTSADGVTEAVKSFKTSGSFTSYFPQDNGTSILAGVTNWKTPTVTTNGETIVNLDLTGPNRLSLSDFKGAAKFGFPSGITYSPCAPLVVKIVASDVKSGKLTLPAFNGAGKTAAGLGISYVMWDLSALTGTVDITSAGEPVRGSIYAPGAHVRFPSGGVEFEGQVIAKQFSALQTGKELHTNLFAGRFAAAPTVATSVSVSGSNDKVLPLTGGQVVDVVSHTGLTAGVEYVVSGELMTAGGTATGIVGSSLFTPTASSGSVAVIFTISKEQAKTYAGQKLVVFESLAMSVDPTGVLASHRDLTDAAQTFSVADPTYAIGDVVWIDADRDGLQDAGESRLAGVTVRLLAASDSSVLKTTTTDADGRYLFDELAAGSYRVQFELTAEQAVAYTFTTANQGSDEAVDSDGVVAGNAKIATTGTIALNSTNSALTTSYTDQSVKAAFGIDPTWDAGVVVDKVSVGDRVWFDANRDGLQSTGEAPAPGVTVRLWPGTSVGVGSPLATTTADAQGYYAFTGLARSTAYSIEIVKPDGASWTTQNAGGRTDNSASADLSDSDVSAAGVISFTSPAGGSNLGAPDAADNHGLDAGLAKYNLTLAKRLDTAGPFAPGDVVSFTLTPHNDGPSAALAGWSVTDLLPSGLELVSITGVDAGSYTCDRTSATCVATAALAAGADGPAVLVTARIKDLAGTMANLSYISPAAGDVAETNPLTVPAAGTDPSTTPTDNDARAALHVDLVSIGDHTWWDVNRNGQQDAGEAPVPGVTVTLSDANGVQVAQTTTDASGDYYFDGLLPNTGYQVKFGLPQVGGADDPAAGFTTAATGASASDSDADPVTGIATVTTPRSGSNLHGAGASDEDDPTIDAGYVKYDLSLTKTLVTAAPFVPGQTVTYELTPRNAGPVAALAGWSVTEVLPAGLSLVSIDGGSAYDCAGLVCTAKAALAANSDGPKITVAARIDADLIGTARNVAYVTPAAADAPEATPLGAEGPTTGTDPSTTPTNNDAAAALTVYPVSIGDHTWWDVNRNGQQDPGETPVPGVTVTLLDAAGVQVAQTTTDPSGAYYFDGLLPGTGYQVQFGLPRVDGVADSTVAFTTPDVGAVDSDSDADPATGIATLTTPSTGTNLHGTGASDEDTPSIDAGYLKYDLDLAKTLVTAGPFAPGQNVSYELVPSNAGPVDALAGWSVTEVLPSGLTLVSIDGGTAYDCSGLVCTAKAGLAAHTTGAKITVTARIAADVTGTLTNVAYVKPSATDIAEANPLGADLPTAQTDPSATSTNNDAAAALTVAAVSIGDFVWYDNDRDGLRGPVGTEPGAAGVTVQLFLGETATGLPVATTATDSTGHYSFTDLLPGTKYTLQFVRPDGFTWTAANAGGSGATADLTDSDVSVAGLVGVTTPLTGSNASTAGAADDPSLDAGLVGYNLTLTKALVTSSAVYMGDTVEFTLTPHNAGPAFAVAGWGVTEVLPTELELVSMAAASDPADYSCTGTTCVAARPLAAGADGPQVTVVARIVANLTGSVKNVAYVFPNDADVAETVGLDRPADAAVDTNASATDNDAEAPVQVSSLVSIGDHVWLDTDRDGQQDESSPLSGVTVNLYAKDGTTALATTTTDATGFYSFAGLRPATEYRVEFVAPSGYTPTGQNLGTASSDSDADAAGVVSFTAPASGGNSLTAPDDPTIDAGFVAYNLTVAKELIGAGPFYEGSTVSFRITPSNAGPAAALAGWSVTEVPQVGLTITGMDGGSTYTCTGSQCVSATDLAAGASAAPITVTAVIGADFVGTLRNVAYVAPAAGDVVESNPLVVPADASVDTAATPTDNDAEASVTVDSLVSQGDYIWWDNDRDGLRSPVEPGVPGLTVRLLDADGNLLRSTTTDDEGRYFFTDLVPGATYQVEFVKPADAAFTRADGGSGELGKTFGSDADPVTGRATFVAAGSGRNLTGKGEVDTPAIDAGLIKYNLTLTKVLESVAGSYPDERATFVLTPHNDGPSTALAGWSITDVLPEDSELVSAAGEGYTCTDATCVNADPIPAGADGPVLTVVTRTTAKTEGEHRNVAYVSPAGDDAVEANVLEIPGRDTDTTTTGTDNDAQAAYVVAGVQDPEPGKGNGGGLAFTGVAGLWPLAGLGAAFLLAGLVLLVVRRREA